jgi:hypothetical protein
VPKCGAVAQDFELAQSRFTRPCFIVVSIYLNLASSKRSRSRNKKVADAFLRFDLVDW